MASTSSASGANMMATTGHALPLRTGGAGGSSVVAPSAGEDQMPPAMAKNKGVAARSSSDGGGPRDSTVADVASAGTSSAAAGPRGPPPAGIARSPSTRSQQHLEAERVHRRFGAQLIQSLCRTLTNWRGKKGHPSTVMVTACHLFHTFLCYMSWTDHDVRFAAAASVMLASKSEEQSPPQDRESLKRLVQDLCELLGFDASEEKSVREKCIKMERRILRVLSFETLEFSCAGMGHPHSFIYMLLDEQKSEQRGSPRRRASGSRSPRNSARKSPRASAGAGTTATSSLATQQRRRKFLLRALAYCNDSLQTSLCVREDSEVIACACLQMAARDCGVRLNPWRTFRLSVTAKHAASVEREILSLYETEESDENAAPVMINMSASGGGGTSSPPRALMSSQPVQLSSLEGEAGSAAAGVSTAAGGGTNNNKVGGAGTTDIGGPVLVPAGTAAGGGTTATANGFSPVPPAAGQTKHRGRIRRALVLPEQASPESTDSENEREQAKIHAARLAKLEKLAAAAPPAPAPSPGGGENAEPVGPPAPSGGAGSAGTGGKTPPAASTASGGPAGIPSAASTSSARGPDGGGGGPPRRGQAREDEWVSSKITTATGGGGLAGPRNLAPPAPPPAVVPPPPPARPLAVHPVVVPPPPPGQTGRYATNPYQQQPATAPPLPADARGSSEKRRRSSESRSEGKKKKKKKRKRSRSKSRAEKKAKKQPRQEYTGVDRDEI